MGELSYGIIIAVLSIAGYLAKGAGEIAEKAFDSIFGGAIEELLESIIDKIRPNSAKFFKKAIDNKKTMTARIIEYLAGLDERERKELADFLENKKKNISQYTGCISSLNIGDEKSVKKCIKQIKKLFNEQLDEIDNINMSDITLKCVDDIIEEMFGTKDAPESVKEIINMINDYVFRLKYISLSTEDRDVVKVIQKMMDDNKADMVRELKGFFDIIISQNAMPAVASVLSDPSLCNENNRGRLISEKIIEIEKRDPFFYVSIECPSCHANGPGVMRKGDMIICTHCGVSSEIIRNMQDEEITERIDKVRSEIGIQLSKTDDLASAFGQANEKLERKVDELARKVVSSEMINEALRGIRSEAIEDARSRDKHLANAIKETAERIINEMSRKNEKDCSGDILSALDSVSHRMEAMNASLIDYLTSIHKETKDIHTTLKRFEEASDADHDVIREMLSEMSARIGDEDEAMQGQIKNVDDKLDQILEFLTYSKEKEKKSNTYVTYCPRCRRHEVVFERLADGDARFKCSCCGYITEDVYNTRSQRCDVPTLTMMKKGRDYVLDFAEDSIKTDDMSRYSCVVVELSLTLFSELINKGETACVTLPINYNGGAVSTMLLVCANDFTTGIFNLAKLSSISNNGNHKVNEFIIGNNVSLYGIGDCREWKTEGDYIVKKVNTLRRGGRR